MFISIDAEISFDKIQHAFMIKQMDYVELVRTNLNTIKAVYKKPTVNIILDGEKQFQRSHEGVRVVYYPHFSALC